jgi:glycosyltransferase involved in cell wall biosynthesis
MTLSVAVILSTYNSPHYLEKVLKGYLGQSRWPDELIVADDGSAEETAALVAEIAARSPFPIRHVWHEDLGFRLAKIRNEAVSAARSDYLIFSDGDCVPHRCFVADHVFLMERGCFVTGKRILIGPELSSDFRVGSVLQMLSSGMRGKLSGIHHLVRFPGLVLSAKGIGGIKGCNFAVFRQDLFRVNGYDENFVGWGREDSDLAARLLKCGLRRKTPPFAAVLYHLWHPENSRDSLPENDELLRWTLRSADFFCQNGLGKSTDKTPSL